MNCPICNQHMQVIYVLNHFNAHCPSNNHSCWGERTNYQTNETDTHGVINTRKVGRRQFIITEWTRFNITRIDSISSKKDYRDTNAKIIVSIPTNEYKKKYENDNEAFKKLIELSEVFA